MKRRRRKVPKKHRPESFGRLQAFEVPHDQYRALDLIVTSLRRRGETRIRELLVAVSRYWRPK